MSTGYNIFGTHVGDFLSINVPETVTVGNTGLSTTIRIYDCNAPLNGYLLTTSNGIFTINEANNSIPTNIGIGTNTPTPGSTLQVQGTFLTSNIGTYNTNNTLYFCNLKRHTPIHRSQFHGTLILFLVFLSQILSYSPSPYMLYNMIFW